MKGRCIVLFAALLSLFVPAFGATIPTFDKGAVSSSRGAAVSAALNRAAFGNAVPSSQELLEAVERNNLTLVNKLLALRVNVNGRDFKGRTPLMRATENYLNIEILRSLLNSHAAVNIKDKEGKTALFHAVEQNNRPATLLLLKAGSDPDTEDNKYYSPLILAVQNNDKELVTILFDDFHATGDPKEPGKKSALFFSIEKGDRDLFIAMAEGGANIYYRGLGGLNAVMYAAALGQSKLLHILLLMDDFYFDKPNDQDEDRTAIMYAAACGSLDCVKQLVAKGAQYTASDKDGAKPYDYAYYNDHFDVANYLKQLEEEHFYVPNKY